MENTIAIKCYCCHSAYNEDDKYCGNCGYPLQGTQEEQKKFVVNYNMTKIEKSTAIGNIKEARTILFVIAAFTVVSAFIIYSRDSSTLLLFINLFLAAIYALLGFWANYKAFAAILTGGLIYVSIILLSAFLDPMTIIQGIIFKVIFIIAFIKASYGAYKFKV